MKIRLRNLVAVDVSQSDNDTDVILRFMTASEHETSVVLPHELLQELTARLVALSSEAGDLAANDKKRSLKKAIRELLSKGAKAA